MASLERLALRFPQKAEQWRSQLEKRTRPLSILFNEITCSKRQIEKIQPTSPKAVEWLHTLEELEAQIDTIVTHLLSTDLDRVADIERLTALRTQFEEASKIKEYKLLFTPIIERVDRLLYADLQARLPQYIGEWTERLAKAPHPLNDQYLEMMHWQMQLSSMPEPPGEVLCWLEQMGELLATAQSLVSQMLAVHIPDMEPEELKVLQKKLKGADKISPTQERVGAKLEEVSLQLVTEEWVFVESDQSTKGKIRAHIDRQSYAALFKMILSFEELLFALIELLKIKAWTQANRMLEIISSKHSDSQSELLPLYLYCKNHDSTGDRIDEKALLADPELDLECFTKGLYHLTKMGLGGYAHILAEKVLDHEPILLIFKGERYLRQQEWEKARGAFKTALEIDEQVADAYKGLAVALDHLKDARGAKEAMHQFQLAIFHTNAERVQQLEAQLESRSQIWKDRLYAASDDEASGAGAAREPQQPTERKISHARDTLTARLNAMIESIRLGSAGKTVRAPSSSVDTAASGLGAVPLFGPLIQWAVNTYTSADHVRQCQRMAIYFPDSEQQIPVIRRASQILIERYQGHFTKMQTTEDIEAVCTAMSERIYAHLMKPTTVLHRDCLAEDLAIAVQKERGSKHGVIQVGGLNIFTPGRYIEKEIKTVDPHVVWTISGIFDETAILHEQKVFIHRTVAANNERYGTRSCDPRELAAMDDFGGKLWALIPQTL